MGRKGLRLVQHDDAVCDLVQMPASAGVCREQRFKEPDVGGDDAGGVPAVAQLPEARIGGGIAVDLQQFRNDLTIVFYVLADDRQKWQNQNNAPFLMESAVLCGKGKETESLSESSGGGESKKTGRVFCGRQAVLKKLIAQTIQ